MSTTNVHRREPPLMVVPTRGQLTAGAVWVTIANWADALDRHFGDVEIHTPAGVLSRQEARTSAFSRSETAAISSSERRGRLIGAKTLVKDLRWAWRGAVFHLQLRHRLGINRNPAFIWQHHDFFQTAGIGLGRRLGIPSVLFVDAPLVWEARKWGVRRRGWGGLLERLGEKPALRRADVVACVSAEVAEAVVNLGVDPVRVIVTPCSAEVPTPTPTGEQVRARHGLDKCFVIGWVGSFRAFHALDLLIETLAASGLDPKTYSLLLVGDGAERGRLMQMCSDLGVPSVFTGSLPHDQVFEHIAAFDCGVITAASGQDFHYSPLKLKEYLAMGVATVVPRVGEMAAMLEDGTDAHLYDPGDGATLVARLTELRDDEAHRRQIAAAGLETFLRQFGMAAQVKMLLDALERSNPTDRLMIRRTA